MTHRESLRGENVTDGLANVGLELRVKQALGPEVGSELELAPDFRSGDDRSKALTDAVVTRHKRYTSGCLSDDFDGDIVAEIKRLQLKTANVKKRLARIRGKTGSDDGRPMRDSVVRDNLSSNSMSAEVVSVPAL